MARRTKEDAQATRNRLLDAAEEVFFVKGVSKASLADVAQAASVTRGAIYWHFKDKADLFDAMMQRGTLPFQQALDAALSQHSEGDSLEIVLSVLTLVLRSLSIDSRTRRVFEIALFKVEHVGELEVVRQQYALASLRFIAMLERGIQAALQRTSTTEPGPSVSPHLAAKGLYALFDGLLREWLLQQGDFDLEAEGLALIVVYLKGLGLNACGMSHA